MIFRFLWGTIFFLRIPIKIWGGTINDYGSYYDVASKKDRSNDNLDVALTKDVRNENFNNTRYKQNDEIFG